MPELMQTFPVTALAWAATIASGLMAGTYFAFSGFIMQAFANLGPERATASMNAINDTILRSTFMPLFFGSTGIAALLLGIGLWSWGETGAWQAVAAGSLYVFGMFAVTVFCNVPLNNALAKAGGHQDQGADMWRTYFVRWTRWNTLRTLASTASCVMSVSLLTQL